MTNDLARLTTLARAVQDGAADVLAAVVQELRELGAEVAELRRLVGEPSDERGDAP